MGFLPRIALKLDKYRVLSIASSPIAAVIISMILQVSSPSDRFCRRSSSHKSNLLCNAPNNMQEEGVTKR